MIIMANDGTIFKNVEDCEKYEQEHEKDLTSIYYQIISVLNEEVGNNGNNYYDGFAVNCDDFNTFNATPEEVARIIISSMATFCISNACDECRTIEGMWKCLQKDRSFGDIAAVYYTNENGNLIRLWE